jgi:hypothetical protein
VGNGNEVDMIVHQTVGLDGNATVARGIREKAKVEFAIGVTIKHLLPIVSALGDMVWDTCDNDAVRAGHT